MFINTFCYAKITLPDVPPACNKASVQQDDGNRGRTQPFSENLLQRFLFKFHSILFSYYGRLVQIQN